MFWRTRNSPELATSRVKAGRAISDRLAKSDPSNARWQHDLSHSYTSIAIVQLAQQNLSVALASYQACPRHL